MSQDLIVQKSHRADSKLIATMGMCQAYTPHLLSDARAFSSKLRNVPVSLFCTQAQKLGVFVLIPRFSF